MLLSTASLAQVVECPATQDRLAEVDFTAADCRQINLQDYVMSSGAVWLRVPVSELLQTPKPANQLRVFVSGNMSADVYINDQFIGSKGNPAVLAENERAGPFDWSVFAGLSPTFYPDGTMTLFMSSHHDLITGDAYFNRLYIGNGSDTTDQYARAYAPSLVPLGAMLIVLFYLFYQRYTHREDKVSACLYGLIAVAIAQLLLEVSRGFNAYAYPLHFPRLYLITLCSTSFGLLLLWFSFKGVKQPFKTAWLWGALVCSLVAQYLINDFDYKAIAAIQIPASIGLMLTITRMRTAPEVMSSRNALFACVFGSLLALTLLTQNAFLDAYFYWCIAGLLLVLVVNEVNLQNGLQAALEETRNEARKLELALSLNHVGTPKTLTVKSASAVTKIPVTDILFCKGAGDYVELVQRDNKTTLYSGSLQQLQQSLPDTFLKVHRSYLVNGQFISSIRRKPSGNGEVSLNSGEVVPVSRNLFNEIRNALCEK